MKKGLFLLFFVILSVLISQTSLAQEDSTETNLYFFWAEGCPHCASEELFLDTLVEKYPKLNIHKLEVTGNKENAELLARFGKELNADVSGVPFTVIGDKYFVGWYNEETTGKSIEYEINKNTKIPPNKRHR